MKHGRYTTDLTDRQWAAIRHLVPAPKPGGRPAKYSRRQIVNAILYQARNGCTWRDLPKDLPPYRIVFHYFRRWHTTGVWQAIHDRLRGRARRQASRRKNPTAGVLDSQSEKSPGPAEARGVRRGEKPGRAECVALRVETHMTSIRIRRKLESDTLRLSELKPLIGRDDRVAAPPP